ncbi:MAG: glutamate synthase [Clostridiales bacterium]|jgi:glutamate synthase domain-containing protein 3|nr:glutamate synthase [Clostridiales bacterium]
MMSDTHINAAGLDFQALNKKIRQTAGDIQIEGCCGQRYIGAGQSGRTITIHGTPGNALGAYMDGAVIVVRGNAQDAVGDTMNDGRIIVHGNAGDALGYGIRGGAIYIRGGAGYRTGIHMKEYQEKKPVIVVGGRAGSFLGEYMAGGLIIVLGIGAEGDVPVGNFTGTGMHGGAIYIRSSVQPTCLPAQVTLEEALPEDKRAIAAPVAEYAGLFGADADELLSGTFYLLRPNAKNPYHTLYAAHLR